MENKCNQKHLQADKGILEILQIYLTINWIPTPTPPPLLFFKGGGVNFKYEPQRGGGLNVFLKERGWLTLFLLNFFKVHHVYIQKLLYPLQNCVMHYFFFCNHNFMKKGLKMNQKISHKLR